MTKGKLLGSREGVSKYFLAASAMPWMGVTEKTAWQDCVKVVIFSQCVFITDLL